LNPRFVIRKPPRKDKKYEAFVRSQPCCICGESSVVHHLYKRDDSYGTVPFCCGHHTDQDDSYHRLGSREEFEEVHNVNLDWVIYELLTEWIVILGAAHESEKRWADRFRERALETDRASEDEEM